MAKRQISAKAFLQDFREGMGEAQLMEKYKISTRGLQKIFHKLVEAGAISKAEFAPRLSSYEDTVTLDVRNVKLSPEATLECLVPIHEEGAQANRGALCQVDERAFTVTGIDCGEGETKALVVDTLDFFQIDPIRLEAKCVWRETRGKEHENLAGFELTNISEDDSQRLKEFIRLFRM